MPQHVRVRTIGTYLPPTVRNNHYWDQKTVASWTEATRPPQGNAKTAGQRAVLAARAAVGSDPFRGARRRRVAEPGMTESEMQVRAARDAMKRAGIEPDEIGLCLTSSSVPLHLTVPEVCIVHRELKLQAEVLSLQIDSTGASFLQQLTVAQGLMKPGRYALLTQGCLGTRLTEPGSNHEPWFGDGATAVLLETCEEGDGLLGFAHATDGGTHESLVTGVPGGTWKDAGVPYFYLRDPAGAASIFANVCAWGERMTAAARSDAGIDAAEIDFFACHQGQAWLRAAIQEFAGLEHAQTFDTFADYGTMFSVNIPLVLRLAADAGTLRPGNLVQGFAGGVGELLASVVFRW